MGLHKTVGERLIKLYHSEIHFNFDNLVHRVARGCNIARNVFICMLKILPLQTKI